MPSASRLHAYDTLYIFFVLPRPLCNIYPARLQLEQKTAKEERKTGNGSTDARAIAFLGLTRGIWGQWEQKRENGEMPRNKKQMGKRWGRRRDSRRPRQPNPEWSQKRIRRLRTKPNSRAEWTLYVTLRGRRQNPTKEFMGQSPHEKNKVLRPEKRIPPEK